MDKENLIRAFESIRDVPYSIPMDFKGPDNCCSGKAIRLKNYFKSQGLEARYRVVDFKWSKLGLPAYVLSAVHSDDSTHVFVEVKLENGWQKVDPTWDRGLSKALPVAEWDGMSDTVLAVPIERYYDDETSEALMQFSKEEFDKERAENLQFYQRINDWLKTVRT